MKKRTKALRLVAALCAAVTAFACAGGSVSAADPRLEEEYISICYEAKKLDAPRNFTVKETPRGIKLSWDMVRGADAYRIYRYNETLGKYIKLSDVKKLSVENTTVTEKTQTFKVAALVKNEDGDYIPQTKSKAVKITVKNLHTLVSTATKLSKPKNLRYEDRGNNTIVLSWDKVENAAAYRVYQYKCDTGKYVALKTTVKTSLRITDVLEKEYIFKVAALSVSGEGLYTVRAESSPFTVNYNPRASYSESGGSSSGSSSEGDAYAGSIQEVYTSDGASYNTQVGDSITFFHSRTPTSTLYAYSWVIEKGEDLVEIDRDGATCKITAKAPGKVVLSGQLDYSVQLGFSYKHYTYTHTMTVNISSRTGDSESSLMNWITCPSCGGSQSITVGGKKKTCPTCGGSGSLLR